MKNVALFGGSFDPPHIGHIAIVEELKKLDFIDEIIVMPTYLNPFKERFSAPPRLRFLWLQKIFKNDPKVIVSDFEISQNQKVPTIKTVKELSKRYGKIYVVIGADNVASLPKWHGFDELQKTAQFIVVTRVGYPIKTHFKTIELSVNVSSTQLRQEPTKENLPEAVAHEIIRFYQGEQ